MSKDLSRIVADLSAISRGGEEQSAKIQHLRAEIQKVVESGDAIVGKFRGLVESFREIIPDENQRYHAAINALSTTAKLSKQEIIKAVNEQLDELKILEKSLLSTLPGRDELNALEARSKEMKDEIAKLRVRAAQIESEEEALRKSMTARGRDMESVEKGMKDIFAQIGTEMTYIVRKVEAFTAEGAAVQPAPQKAPVKSDVPPEKKKVVEPKIEIQAAPAPMDPKWQKKCPMCGGVLNFLSMEKKWMCYSCAHEEPESGASQESGFGMGEPENAPAPEPSSEPSSSFAVPLGDLSFDDEQKQKKRSSSSANKTKPCPSCRKKMYWHEDDKAWRCSTCGYETRMLN